jgi:hypothetical protein
MTSVKKRGSRRTAREVEQDLLVENLNEEIATLRGLMREMAEAFDAGMDVPERLRILAVLSQASARLAQVLKIQSQLGGGAALVEEIRQVAEEVRRELEGRGAPENPTKDDSGG